jgi:hypothetical protein
MYLEQIYPLYYSLNSLLPHFSVCVCVCVCVCIIYSNPLQHPEPSCSPPPPHWYPPSDSPTFTFMSHYCPAYWTSSSFRSRFHTWAKTCDIWLSELPYLTQIMISSSKHFPANGIISFFFMTEQYSMMCIFHIFLYLFSSWWASRLIPQFGYCEQCYNKHGYAGISLVGWSTSLQMRGHKVGLCLVFGRTSILIFIVITLVFIPTTVRMRLCQHKLSVVLMNVIWLGWEGSQRSFDVHFLYG